MKKSSTVEHMTGPAMRLAKMAPSRVRGLLTEAPVDPTVPLDLLTPARAKVEIPAEARTAAVDKN